MGIAADSGKKAGLVISGRPESRIVHGKPTPPARPSREEEDASRRRRKAEKRARKAARSAR
jgi:hypothetical protein